jgi:hypothetical protein
MIGAYIHHVVPFSSFLPIAEIPWSWGVSPHSHWGFGNDKEADAPPISNCQVPMYVPICMFVSFKHFPLRSDTLVLATMLGDLRFWYSTDESLHQIISTACVGTSCRGRADKLLQGMWEGGRC